MATDGLQIYTGDAQIGDLKLWRAPEEVLIEAQQAAQALQKRIAGKKKPVVFNGEQYIENDDWQMLSNFFGYSPKIESCEHVIYGDCEGFKAVAVLINERTGIVVSRGEALCLDEEENWGPRTKYKYENGRRVAAGEVDTPLFQLASMAQTRACNKAMSNKLKWVVSLAGYATTPAEDMHEATVAPKEQPLPTEIKRKPITPNQVSPTRTAAQTQPSPTQSAPPRQEAVINEAQSRRFYAIWKQAGKTKAQVIDFLQSEFGIRDDRQMPVSGYQKACKWAEEGF